MKKVVSIILVISLLFSMIVFNTATAVQAVAQNYSIIYNFESSLQGFSGDSISVTFAYETTETLHGLGSLKMSANGLDETYYGQGTAYISPPDATGYDGICFRLKSNLPANTHLFPWMRSTSISSYQDMILGKFNTMTDINGNVISTNTFDSDWNHLIMPTGLFDGYIFLPFDGANGFSWDPPLTIPYDLSSLMLKFDCVQNTSYWGSWNSTDTYFDNFAYYKGTDYATLTADMNKSFLCDVDSVATPESAVIDTNTITANVQYSTSSITVDITTSANASWKLYSNFDCSTEITDKVMSLVIGENTAYIKVTAQDGITTKIYTLVVTNKDDVVCTINVYTVSDDGTDIITGISPNTNLTSFMQNIDLGTDATFIATNCNEEIIEATDLVGTGTKLNVYNPDLSLYKSYTIVIYGEIDGNGEIDISDLVAIKSHLLNITLLTEYAFISANIYNKGNISISDLLLVKKHILGIELISQTQMPLPMLELQSVMNVTLTITYVPQYDYSDSVKAIFYTGMDYQDNPTRVFAYIGIPTGATSENKVPGVVCVHGGGGKAFGAWVQTWVDKGYAAIAMDTYGNMPSVTNTYGDVAFTRDSQGAAPYDAFAGIDDPINQQWPFYTVSDAILANSILRVDDRIQTDKIGLTGISWGGLFAGITAGVDDRFAYAIPVYGCGFLDESLTYFNYYYQFEKIEAYWDVANYLPFVKMPVLWINGDSDGAFSINSFSKTVANTPDGASVIKHNMAHSHSDGWEPNEIYRFADKICMGGNGLTEIISQPTRYMGSDVSFDIEVPSGQTVSSIIAYYITSPLAYDSNSVIQNTWSTVSGSYSGGTVSVTLPDGVNSYYVNIETTENSKTSIVSTLLVVSPVSLPDSNPPQATYYVSTTGNDSNSGTLVNPFLTIEHAKDVVRTVNSDMTGDIIVYLRGGTYTLNSTFELASDDSGTNGYNVIYKNYYGENPIISGGVLVTGWSIYDVGNNIYRANVGTSFYSRDLFVDGVKATRAKSTQNPSGFSLNENCGFNLPISGTYSNMASWGNIQDIEIHQNVMWLSQWGSIDSISSGVIHMKQPFWSSNASLNLSNAGMTYPEYIENAYELLDTAGEWYLDRTTGYLYYKPLTDQNMATIPIVLAKLEKLVDGNSAGSLDDIMQNISFNGLAFANSTYLQPLTNEGRADHQTGVQFGLDNGVGVDTLTFSALDFNFSKEITIEDCTVSHIGASGIGFRLGSQDNTISNNNLSDIGVNGISIGDIHYDYWWNGLNELGMTDRNPTDIRCIVSGNEVSNNTITKIGNAIPDAVGVFLGYAKDTLVDHNTIYNIPYSGISVGYGWGFADDTANFDTTAIGNNTITYNRIYNLMNVLYDGGGIYTNGQSIGSTIKYNYISGQNERYGYIYIDGASSNYTVSDNVVSNENGTYTKWFLSQDYYTDDKTYMQTYDNDIEYNYYSSDLSVYKNCVRNTLTNNISVSNNNWDQHASDIIACAGAGSGTVTTNNALRGANLALNKTTTVSQYLDNNSAYNGQKAIDGLTTTTSKWSADICSSAWLEIDFGTSTTFNTTVLRESTENGQNIKAYQIQYWNGSSWINAYSGSVPHFVETNVFNAVTASKVRLNISSTQGDGPSVLEFEVYNVTMPSTYIITNRLTTTLTQGDGSLVITPYGYSASTADLIQYTYTGNSFQKWTVSSLGSGNYKIVSVGSSLVITPNGYSDVDGTKLIQQSWANNTRQYWQLVPTGDGYFKIKNSANGLLITPTGHSLGIVTLVQSADALGYDQHWSLDAIQ